MRDRDENGREIVTAAPPLPHRCGCATLCTNIVDEIGMLGLIAGSFLILQQNARQRRQPTRRECVSISIDPHCNRRCTLANMFI